MTAFWVVALKDLGGWHDPKMVRLTDFFNSGKDVNDQVRSVLENCSADSRIQSIHSAGAVSWQGALTAGASKPIWHLPA
jgi:hypothetical protein